MAKFTILVALLALVVMTVAQGVKPGTPEAAKKAGDLQTASSVYGIGYYGLGYGYGGYGLGYGYGYGHPYISYGYGYGYPYYGGFGYYG